MNLQFKLKSVFCALILLHFCTIPLFAQLSKPAPKNPEASALARSIEYPVSNSTGVPNITIPLMDVVSGDLKYNLQLNYHSGGIKVGQLPTWVGLNWTLDAAPQITRTVNGLDDLSGLYGYVNSGLFNAYDVARARPDNGYLARLSKDNVDEQPDEFYYKLMDKSGKFLYQKYSNKPAKAMPVPYDQLDIQYNSTLGTFTIIDDNGTKYEFGGTGYTERSYPVGYDQTVTAWKCKKITSPDGKDVITFDYHPVQTKYKSAFLDQAEIYEGGSPTQSMIPFDRNSLDPIVDINSAFRPNPAIMKVITSASIPYVNTYFIFAPYGDQTYDFMTQNIYFDHAEYYPEGLDNTRITDEMSLKQINFNGNKIEFDVDHQYGEVLKSIKVTNYLGEYIKTYEFDVYGFHLKEVTVKSNLSKKESYKFEYNPSTGYELSNNLSSDAWGYLNISNVGSVSEEYLIPFYDSNLPYQWVTATSPASFSNGQQSYTFPLGKRSLEANENDMKGDMLNKIIYPGGGYTEFEYEANKYLNNSLEKLAGGLRIKSIKDYTESGTTPVTEKFFKYGQNEDGIGVEINNPNVLNFEYFQMGYWQEPLSSPYTMPTTINSNFTKRTFVKSSLDNNTFSNGAPINYPYVTIYESADGHETGKTTYHYNLSHSNYRYGYTPLTTHQLDINNGQLLDETNYAYIGGNFEWIKKKEYTYDLQLFPERIHVGKAFNQLVLMGDIVPQGSEDPDATWGNFVYLTYGLNVGYSRLVGETETTRQLTNLAKVMTKQTTSYYDNPDHIYPTRKAYLNSKNEIITAYTLYPQDYLPDHSMITSLVNNHKLNYPIEQITVNKSNNTIISANRSTYGVNAENYYLTSYATESSNPIPIANFKFSNVGIGQWPESNTKQVIGTDAAYVEKLKADKYDAHGNPVQFTTNGKQKSTYIYAYKGIFPTVEVENIEYDAISTAIGGTVLQSFEDSSPNKAGVDAFITLIKTTYPNAHITSHTYKPLVGMKSTTDIKRMSTYFEYDIHQRLQLIKDQLGNIVKSFCYNYAGQTTDCYSGANTDNSNVSNNSSAGAPNTAISYVNNTKIYTTTNLKSGGVTQLTIKNSAGATLYTFTEAQLITGITLAPGTYTFEYQTYGTQYVQGSGGSNGYGWGSITTRQTNYQVSYGFNYNSNSSTQVTNVVIGSTAFVISVDKLEAMQ